ncbi:hypothetical protein HGM15179_014467, partial [Zosterops borbonicus]
MGDREHREHREYRRLEEGEEDSPPGEEEEEEQLLLHVTEGPTVPPEERLCLRPALRHPGAAFLFVVAFSTFLLCCVDYDVLFATRPLNHSHVPERPKVTLPDAVLPAPQCASRPQCSPLLQVFILEELLSPLVTPLILIFAFPRRALDIVDFFRNFTVEVAGVGDICSFAQLDVRHHGHPQ